MQAADLIQASQGLLAPRGYHGCSHGHASAARGTKLPVPTKPVHPRRRQAACRWFPIAGGKPRLGVGVGSTLERCVRPEANGARGTRAKPLKSRTHQHPTPQGQGTASAPPGKKNIAWRAGPGISMGDRHTPPRQGRPGPHQKGLLTSLGPKGRNQANIPCTFSKLRGREGQTFTRKNKAKPDQGGQNGP